MWLLTLIVIALVSAACTGDTAGTTTTSTTSSAPPDQGGDLPVLEDVEFPEWEPTSRTEQISAQIDDEGLTPQLAIDALSLIVDDVPGASSSDLPPGEGFGGYYTSLLLEEVRADLTQEQRSFVDAYFAEGRHIGTVRADGSIESVGEPTSATSLLVSVANVAVPQVLAAAPVALSEDDYLELLAQVHQHWLAYLPMMPEFDVKLTFSDTGSGMSAGMPETGLCHIEVYGSFTNRPQVLEDEVIWFFAHELFHCAQHTWRGATIPPDWVIEGSADWAAYDLLRNETLDFEGGYIHWLVLTAPGPYMRTVGYQGSTSMPPSRRWCIRRGLRRPPLWPSVASTVSSSEKTGRHEPSGTSRSVLPGGCPGLPTTPSQGRSGTAMHWRAALGLTTSMAPVITPSRNSRWL
jgi:hypothetical protein